MQKDNKFQFPEEAVDKGKQMRLADAAEDLIHEIDWKYDIRYDIISITLQPNAIPDIVHFEDAFWPGEIF